MIAHAECAEAPNGRLLTRSSRGSRRLFVGRMIAHAEFAEFTEVEMKQLPIAGFSLTVANGSRRKESLAYKTAGLQWRCIHSTLFVDDGKLAVDGRFFMLHYHEEFDWNEIVGIRTRRAWPLGHCLEFDFCGGERLRVYCTTTRQREMVLGALPVEVR